MKIVEQGATVFTAAEIRVALLPVGNVPPSVLQEYCELIETYRHVELSSVRSFYHEKQKSPLKYLPWTNGALHFRFIQESVALQVSPLAALHASRCVLGVIGICHIPNAPDVTKAYANFEKMAKKFPHAKALRCFAFEPLDDELNQDIKQKEHLIMFPPGDRFQMEQHVEVLMHDFAACVLMELQQGMLNQAIGSMSLSTAIDEPDFSGFLGIADDMTKKLGSEEEVRHRRRHTRLEKLLGDWCLLAGSPRDALEHYNTCIELAKMSGDVVWSAAALEGLAEAKVIEVLVNANALPKSRNSSAPDSPGSPGSEVATPKSRQLRSEAGMGFGGSPIWKAIKRAHNVESQVRSWLTDAFKIYQRRGILPLQIEVELKRVRLAAGLHGRNAKVEVSEVLTQVMEQWPLLKMEEDRINVVVEAAQVLGLVGALRKRALLVWQALESVGHVQRQDEKRTLLEVALKALDPPGDHEAQDLGHFRRMDWGLTHCALPSCASWYILHRAMLEALLPAASRANCQPYVWEAASTLLRCEIWNEKFLTRRTPSFSHHQPLQETQSDPMSLEEEDSDSWEHHTALSPENVEVLLDSLEKASKQMDSVERQRPGPGPPPLFQVRNVCPLNPELRPAKVSPDGEKALDQGPFIFNPLMKKRAEAMEEKEPIQWVVGEECSVEVYIANPVSAQLKVERLSLHAEAGDEGDETKVAQKVPVAVVLPPRTKPTRVTLSLVPLVWGKIRITGVNVTIFGVTFLQRFSPKLRQVPRTDGISVLDAPWGGEKMMVVDIDVLPPLPLLKASLLSWDTEPSVTSPRSPPSSPRPTTPKEVQPASCPICTLLEGQRLKCKLAISNPSKLDAVYGTVTCTSSLGFKEEKVVRGEVVRGVNMRIEPDALQQHLPLAAGGTVEVPVWIDVGLRSLGKDGHCQDVTVKTTLRYKGDAESMPEEYKKVGRQFVHTLKLNVTPSIKISSLVISNQFRPVASMSASGKQMSNGQQNGNVNVKQGRNVDRVSANGIAGVSDSVNGDPLRAARLEKQCVMQLDVMNASNTSLDVWLGRVEQGLEYEAKWEAASGSSEETLVPNQGVQLGCLIPVIPPDNPATPPHVSHAVAEWICSQITPFWRSKAQLTQPSSPHLPVDDSNESVNLTPSFGSHGVCRLLRDAVLKTLSPHVIAMLAQTSVTISVDVVEGAKMYEDVSGYFPVRDPDTPVASSSESHGEWAMQNRSIMNDSTSTIEEAQTDSSRGLVDFGVVDAGPMGPNGEIWGVQVSVGEVVECAVTVENREEQDAVLSIAVCCQQMDGFGDNGGFSFGSGGPAFGSSGLVFIGKVSKVPMKVEKSKFKKHRFSVCCVMPGLYQVYACDDTETFLDHSKLIPGFKLNILCKDEEV